MERAVSNDAMKMSAPSADEHCARSRSGKTARGLTEKREFSTLPPCFTKEHPVSLEARDQTAHHVQHRVRSLCVLLVTAHNVLINPFSTLSKEAGPWIVIG